MAAIHSLFTTPWMWNIKRMSNWLEGFIFGGIMCGEINQFDITGESIVSIEGLRKGGLSLFTSPHVIKLCHFSEPSQCNMLSFRTFPHCFFSFSFCQTYQSCCLWCQAQLCQWIHWKSHLHRLIIWIHRWQWWWCSQCWHCHWSYPLKSLSLSTILLSLMMLQSLLMHCHGQIVTVAHDWTE